MRNLAIIALLFIGVSEPPDSVKQQTKDSLVVYTRSMEVKKRSEMTQDIDTIKIMIKDLKDAINKVNSDTIPGRMQ